MGDLDFRLIDDSLAIPVPRSQYKLHDDRFSRFCTGYRRMSLYFAVCAPFPQKLPLPMLDLDPRHLTHDSLASCEPCLYQRRHQ